MENGTEKAISIAGLTKRFVSTTALENINLDISRGTITGLLGPNGAGKTTLLRIINNILIPDSGDVRIFGEKAGMATSRRLGYMPEERGLYDNMRVEDQVMYFGRLKGGDKTKLRRAMNEYLEVFNLTADRRRRIKELSKGNQQKVQIVATLVHEPDIVVLDEPFSGFDPINGQILSDLIARLHRNGTSIILSSHNMSAIEEMCTHIALINHGHLLLDGPIDDIKERHKTEHILVTTRTPLNESILIDSGIVAQITPTDSQRHRKGYPYIILKATNVSNHDILMAISAQADIVHFEEKLPSLNDLFIQYTTRTNAPAK